MTDKTTRLTLIAIALGLWFNVFGHYLAPRPAHADDDSEAQMASDISSMQTDISDMQDDIHNLVNGTCVNSTLCR